MVSIREVERIIKRKNNGIHWTGKAKKQFAETMQLVMAMMVDRIEYENFLSNDKKRVGELAVKAVMCHIVEKINKGDEDEV
jgi:hypothetical protein